MGLDEISEGGWLPMIILNKIDQALNLDQIESPLS